jgi:hypothetical protein
MSFPIEFCPNDGMKHQSREHLKERKVKYTDEPVGKVKIVDDFLPKPDDLVLKTEKVKVKPHSTKSK